MSLLDLCVKVASIKGSLSLLSIDIQRISLLVASACQSSVELNQEIEKLEALEQKTKTLERLENELYELKFTIDSIESMLPVFSVDSTSKPKLTENPNSKGSVTRTKRSLPSSPEIPPSDLTRRHHRDYIKPKSMSLNSFDADKERLLCELEILYEKTPIGMCLVDKHFRYVRVNQMLATIQNLDIKSHYGHTVREVAPCIADKVEALISKVFHLGEPVLDVEIGDSFRSWLVSLLPVNFPDSQATPPCSPLNRPAVDAVAIIVKDITDIKQKEADLIREKELVEEANQTKTRFLAHMSHELRTPMACIIGMVNFLLETDLSVDQQEYAMAIQQNATSLLQILNDILDISKVEAGKVILEPVPCDIVAVIERVAEIFSYKVNEKRIELHLQFDPRLKRLYIGDIVRLRQILWNLVGNSVKFTDRGKITIEVGRPPGSVEGLTIKVADTGIGIPTDQIHCIFREFKQADSAPNRKYSGTGLGLAIVERLANLMGGNVSVASEVNKGTTFTLFLPLPAKPDSPVIADNYSLQEVRRMQQQHSVECAIISASSELPRIIDQYLEMCHLKNSTWSTLESFMERHIPTVVEPTILLIDCCYCEEAEQIVNHLKSMETSIILIIPIAQKLKITHYASQSLRYLSKPLIFSHFITAIYESICSFVKEDAKAISKPAKLIGKAPLLFPNVSVLVVEDNLFNQTILQKILQRMKCTVDTAGNGREAVAKVQKNHYDIVFMDLQMPILDGYTATEQIRSIEKASESQTNVPIIAVTAHAMSTDRTRCLEVGMDGYITKPIDAAQVHAVMTEFIGRKVFDKERK